MGQGIGLGDEVTITATILRLHDNNGRASVSIPTSDIPYSIDAPKKAKPGDKVPLTGLVMRIDSSDRKVTVKISGFVTVDLDSVIAGAEKEQHSQWHQGYRSRRALEGRSAPF